MATSFEGDIRPLFREVDREQMLISFDLWSYEAVREKAEPILDRLSAGEMPCDGAWPAEQVERFTTWIEEGMQR